MSNNLPVIAIALTVLAGALTMLWAARRQHRRDSD